MLRPDGRPRFRFRCDRTERVAGLTGHHITVWSAKTGTHELEMILSPESPLPLYVREYTGNDPLTIVLVRRGRVPVN